MSFLIRQRLAVMAILVILVPLNPGQVLAQEPSPFEIRITPWTEFATVGQPFTYTVTIANVGQSSLSNIIVRVPVPEGSSLINTYFANPDWLVGGAQRGESGDVIWLTQEAVAPAGKMTFELVVAVPSQDNEQLVMEDYAVILIDNQEVLAAGPPITTDVMAPSTPQPASSPTQSETPVLPTSTAAVTPTLAANVDTVSPTEVVATPVALQEPNPTNAPPSSTTQNEASDSNATLLMGVWAIVGLALLILIILGLVRLLRRT